MSLDPRPAPLNPSQLAELQAGGPRGKTAATRYLPRKLGTVVLASAMAATIVRPVYADLTLSGFSQVSALNHPNRSQETLYLKKDRLRRDLTERGRSYTYLYDLKQRELTFIDHLFRQAEVRRLETGEQKGAPKFKDLKLELTPTGRKHDLTPWECVEHQVKASLPGSMGQEQVVVNLDGQVWLAPNTREQRHIDPFIKSIPAQDLFIGVPTQGRAATTQVQGVGEVLRRILPKGMLCAFDIQIDYEGAGPMANLARRMSTRVSLVYENVSETALKDEMFAIPAGYQVNRP
ncbi:MAG: hypothetical protein ACUVSD_02250 [Thiobacillaceae bacterium]